MTQQYFACFILFQIIIQSTICFATEYADITREKRAVTSVKDQVFKKIKVSLESLPDATISTVSYLK